MSPPPSRPLQPLQLSGEPERLIPIARPLGFVDAHLQLRPPLLLRRAAHTLDGRQHFFVRRLRILVEHRLGQ